MRRLALLLVALVVLLLASAPVASAQGGVVPGEQVIDSGQTYNGNLVVPGGKLTIRQGGTVRGDIAILGGELDVAGTVQGNVVSMGGTVRLRDTAVIQGDMTSVGGSVDRAAGARVTGAFVTPGGVTRPPQVSPPGAVPPLPGLPPVPGSPTTPFQTTPRNPLGDALGWLGRTLLLTLGAGLLGLLAMLLLPRQMANIASTIEDHTAASTGMGAMTWIVWILAFVLVAIMTVLLAIVCIGLLGVPILIAMSIVLPIAVLLGWLATSLLFGQKLFGLFGARGTSPLLTITVGAILLTFLSNMLNLIPCAGPILGWLITLPGLGAVVLTWFGSRPYRPGDPYLPSWRRGSPAPSSGPIPSAPYGGYGAPLPPPSTYSGAAETAAVAGTAAAVATAGAASEAYAPPPAATRIPTLDELTRSVTPPAETDPAAADLRAQGFTLPEMTPDDLPPEVTEDVTVETLTRTPPPPPEPPKSSPSPVTIAAAVAAGAALGGAVVAATRGRHEPPPPEPKPVVVPWEEVAGPAGEPEWLPALTDEGRAAQAEAPGEVVVPWAEAAGPVADPQWPAPLVGVTPPSARAGQVSQRQAPDAPVSWEAAAREAGDPEWLPPSWRVAATDVGPEVVVPWEEAAGPAGEPEWPTSLADTGTYETMAEAVEEDAPPVVVPWEDVAGPPDEPVWPGEVGLVALDETTVVVPWQDVAGPPAQPEWALNMPGSNETPTAGAAETVAAPGDDLRRVLHIGPTRARFLNRLGIRTFASLAAMPPEVIERLFNGVDPETGEPVMGISIEQARTIQASARSLAEAQARR